MGNVAVAEELAGSDELDELYRLDASETGPEDDEATTNDEASTRATTTTGIRGEDMPTRRHGKRGGTERSAPQAPSEVRARWRLSYAQSRGESGRTAVRARPLCRLHFVPASHVKT